MYILPTFSLTTTPRAPSAPPKNQQQDKDLWDELEAEANTLVADTETPLWEKVRGGGSYPNGTGSGGGSDLEWDGSEALAESLFGDGANDDRASLQIQKADFTVNSIIDKINRNKVNLRPSYQREYVWTVKTGTVGGRFPNPTHAVLSLTLVTACPYIAIYKTVNSPWSSALLVTYGRSCRRTRNSYWRTGNKRKCITNPLFALFTVHAYVAQHGTDTFLYQSQLPS